MQKLTFLHNTLTIILILMLGAIILHGLLGSLIRSDYAFYCSMRAVIHQTSCPPSSSGEGSGYIHNLLLSNSENQKLFQAAVFFFMLSLLLFLGGKVNWSELADTIRSFRQLPVKIHYLWQIKLRRWSQRLIQSPAIIGA
ncbi:MAG: hypothetical protein A3I44_02820 [Candidatus Sungbacteria bacterium RIFCSPLOWO2_02_FULL_51_17]|uniref:Uncharacterized protein n=1 Tax=Candidatus Sungbacteria bacterium RIFCSPHIGHO2_02_FULL_51_29 TaxID=1802273 RepID=A0A1G2KRP8_9BACT|nr:MAG: hypothetical protein A2676_00475 [Candidatus Sungbacteria bacterium RIFCSPHIGHO2_01_FULL_51_22]OHA02060.1 MAG: hypothetical protein A3C16_04310 [Candidatus Sungbacteria bacterium RIFCSPHIGHO2_02_FULL_51_29]OHA10828.1 MAG: hypothetical protein A3I44_02820 [Candidatus Sungbacteria bacterium RIFCSPLOWO2_02_FULL_51_17]